MKSSILKCVILLVMLTGLPWIGVLTAGYPLQTYLEFPPQTLYLHPAPFSWAAFSGYALLIAAVIFPLTFRSIQNIRRYPLRRPFHPFPLWGWIGVWGVLLFWMLAWTRFSWFVRFQAHTFAPLWMSFILVINALSMRRSGTCMLARRTRYFILLFPFSAVFWWFFEYLNRFVQNWHYIGPRFEPLEYFLYATLSFSTVLPAVLSMQEFMLGFDWVARGFANGMPIRCGRPGALAAAALSVAGLGLLLLGVFPDYLFPLLWVSPLLIIVALQSLTHEPHVLSDLAEGNWQRVVSLSMAGLCCGFFWEMWNIYSLAKWEYRIPFVQRYHFFEMPLLGYAGYLPFGLECGAVGGILAKILSSK